MPALFQIKTFITYWLESVDEHSLHSPFFFDFYKNVLKKKTSAFHSEIESLRTKLKNDDREIQVEDFGAGSKHLSTVHRKIGSIAKTSLSPPKYASPYSRVIQNYQKKNIVELGTSLGINTLYLAKNPDVFVTTFEGSRTIAETARITFEFAKAENIKLIEGNIDNTLPDFLQSSGKIDFVFMDANHRYEPTLKYFNLLLHKTHPLSIIVVDDIHYSREMEEAWNYLRHHSLVYGSVDLYRCGLLFLDPSLNKQHVVLQF